MTRAAENEEADKVIEQKIQGQESDMPCFPQRDADSNASGQYRKVNATFMTIEPEKTVRPTVSTLPRASNHAHLHRSFQQFEHLLELKLRAYIGLNSPPGEPTTLPPDPPPSKR